MATKISAATKRLALEKLQSGLSVREVADLTGVSTRTLDRWKGKPGAKTAVPGGSAPVATATPIEPPPVEDKPVLDFEEAPATLEHKGVVGSALSSLKGMLGIADKKDATSKTTQPVFTAKLDARRQNFVDSAAPTISLAFMAMAVWLWRRIGPEYSGLAPDEAVAQKIVTPLLRVYARHASFITDVNPDVADVAASMFALVAYVDVSLKLYQHIKQDQEENENQDEVGSRRIYRNTAQSENGTGNGSHGHAAVRGRSGGDDSDHGGNGGNTEGVSLAHLSDKEARQYQALSHLAELDYNSRLRRSGRA